MSEQLPSDSVAHDTFVTQGSTALLEVVPHFLEYLQQFGKLQIIPDREIQLEQLTTGWGREIWLNSQRFGRVEFTPHPPRLHFDGRLPESGDRAVSILYEIDHPIGETGRRDGWKVPFP